MHLNGFPVSAKTQTNTATLPLGEGKTGASDGNYLEIIVRLTTGLTRRQTRENCFNLAGAGYL